MATAALEGKHTHRTLRYLGLQIHSIMVQQERRQPRQRNHSQKDPFTPQPSTQGRLRAFTPRSRPQHDSVEAEQELQR